MGESEPGHNVQSLTRRGFQGNRRDEMPSPSDGSGPFPYRWAAGPLGPACAGRPQRAESRGTGFRPHAGLLYEAFSVAFDSGTCFSDSIAYSP